MKAAELIWNSWESGNKIKSIPSQLAPQNRLEAYKIQENLEVLSNSEMLGWKIAATSLDGQKHIGVNGPLAGRILSNKSFKPGASVALGHNKMAVAEPEFAFKISLTLEPKNKLYIPEEVIDFIEDLHLAIELPDSRFEDFSKIGELGLIADNACAHQFVISSPIKFEWQNNTLSVNAPTCKFKILQLSYKLLPQNNKSTKSELTVNFRREWISVSFFITAFFSLLREVGRPTLLTDLTYYPVCKHLSYILTYEIDTCIQG